MSLQLRPEVSQPAFELHTLTLTAACHQPGLYLSWNRDQKMQKMVKLKVLETEPSPVTNYLTKFWHPFTYLISNSFTQVNGKLVHYDHSVTFRYNDFYWFPITNAVRLYGWTFKNMYLTITTASIRIMLQMRSHLKIHNVDNQQFWPLPRIFVSDICCIAVTTEPVWSVACVALHGLHQPLSLSTRSSYFPIKHRFGDNWRRSVEKFWAGGKFASLFGSRHSILK